VVRYFVVITGTVNDVNNSSVIYRTSSKVSFASAVKLRKLNMSPLCSEQTMYAHHIAKRQEKAAVKIQRAYRRYAFGRKHDNLMSRISLRTVEEDRIEPGVRYNTAGYDHHHHHIFAYY